MGNCASGTCGDNSFAKLLIENDALISLQPAVLNSNLIIAVKASYIIACLASQADFMEVIVQSGALSVIEDVLQVSVCVCMCIDKLMYVLLIVAYFLCLGKSLLATLSQID